MHRPHVPIERDIAGYVRAYHARGGDPGEILVAVGRTFPDAMTQRAGGGQ